MKKTLTILLAALMMTGFASCFSNNGNGNANPIAAISTHRGIYSEKTKG